MAIGVFMFDFTGLHAPFLISWLGVWLFALLGGIASAFIVIGDIDGRVRLPIVAKPIIGTTAGLAMSILINHGQEPPSPTLAFWAWLAAICSTPIISGFLVFISDQKRQNDLYESAQDKFLKWSKNKKDEGKEDKYD